jgi:hypothetical protein
MSWTPRVEGAFDKHLRWKDAKITAEANLKEAQENVLAEGKKAEPNWERYDRLQAVVAQRRAEYNQVMSHPY